MNRKDIQKGPAGSYQSLMGAIQGGAAILPLSSLNSSI